MVDNPFAINFTPKPFDFSGAQGEFGSYIDKYKSAISSLPKASNIYQEYSQKLGVPELQEGVNRYRQQIGDMQNALFDVPQTVKDTTRESLVTEGQRQRMVGAQSAPIEKNLARLVPAASSLEQTLGQAQQGASALTGMDVAQQEQSLLPFEKEYDFNTRKLAMEVAGWSDAQKMELDTLIQNAQSGLAWTNAEKDRAQQLSLAEMGYKNALEQIAAQGANAIALKKAPTDLATLYKSIVG